jgi:hypothetical protein
MEKSIVFHPFGLNDIFSLRALREILGRTIKVISLKQTT